MIPSGFTDFREVGVNELSGLKMEVVAVVSDVHANLPALEAVLEHGHSRGAAETWNLGDHVGYNVFPDETISRLRQVRARSVIGDYDLRVLAVQAKLASWRRKKHPAKLGAFLWADSKLSVDNREYLRGLPRSRRFHYAGFSVFMSHGSPAALNDGLSETTEDEHLQRIGGMVEADILLGGDSHQAFYRRLGDQLFVNPGSVGRPDDGDPRASYALLRFQSGTSVEVELHRVEYDVERAIEGLIRFEQPPEFVEMIRRGRNFNHIESEMREPGALHGTGAE
jgi:putative phosphoesterase